MSEMPILIQMPMSMPFVNAYANDADNDEGVFDGRKRRPHQVPHLMGSVFCAPPRDAASEGACWSNFP
jgi:hypothetical protein